MRLHLLMSSLLLLVGCESSSTDNMKHEDNPTLDGSEVYILPSANILEIANGKSAGVQEVQVLENNGYKVKIRDRRSEKRDNTRGAIYGGTYMPSRIGLFAYGTPANGTKPPEENIINHGADIEVSPIANRYVVINGLRFPYTGLLSAYTYGPKMGSGEANGAIRSVSKMGDYGLPKIVYYPKSAFSENCVDLIEGVSYKMNKNNATTPADGGYGFVSRMDHILAKIGFEVRSVGNRYVTELQILGDMPVGGTYTLNSAQRAGWSDIKKWAKFHINMNTNVYAVNGIIREDRLMKPNAYLLVPAQNIRDIGMRIFIKLNDTSTKEIPLVYYGLDKLEAGKAYTFVIEF